MFRRLISRENRFELIAVALLLTLSLGVRVTGLQRFIANDEIRWTCRSIQFREALRERNWAGTFRVGHPGVVTTWLGAIFIPPSQDQAEAVCRLSEGGMDFDKVDTTSEGRTRSWALMRPLLFAGRTGVALFTWVCVVATFLLIRLLWGMDMAVLSLILLALAPLHLALSRVLHIDAVLASLMTLSLLSLLVALRGSRSGMRYLGMMLLSGGLGGLAMLEKSPAMFLAPFSALVMAIDTSRRAGGRKALGRAARDLVLWGLAAGIVYLAFWPAMWVEPVGTAQRVLETALGYAEEGHEPGSYFFGVPVHDPGWCFYPVMLLFRLSPPALVGLVIGLISLVGDTKRVVPRSDLLILLLYSLLFSAFMSMGAKKLDRYLLPIFPSLGVVAAAGLLWAARVTHAGGLRGSSPGRWIVLSIILLLQLAAVLPHYPHYVTYYNPLVGGGRQAQNVLKMGWGEGYEQAAAYLNEKPDPEQLQVVVPNLAPFAPLFRGDTRPMGAFSTSETDYVLFYLAQVQRRHDKPLMEKYFDNPEAQPEHIVTLHGVDYVWIYPNKNYVAPLSYLEDHIRPERDVLLVNRDSVLSRHCPSTLRVREFQSSSSPRAVAALLDDLPGGSERIWYARHSSVDPETVLRLLQNRALLVERQSFGDTTLHLYRMAEENSVSHNLDFRFGDLRLLGYQSTDPSPAWGRDGGVFLHWTADQTLAEDYTAFVHLYDSHGHRIAQGDSLIVNRDLLPTSQWVPGTSGTTLHHLSIPAGTPPGRYELRVGAYDLETGERLPLLSNKGEQQGAAARLEVEVGVSDRVPDPNDLAITPSLEQEITPNLMLLSSELGKQGVPAGERVSLELIWQSLEAPRRDYRLQLLLLDDDGRVLAERESSLVSTDYVTSQWRPGELVREHYYVSTDEGMDTGDVTLALNLLDQHEGPVLEQPVKVADVWVQSKRPNFDVPSGIELLDEFSLGDKISMLGYHLNPEEGSPGDTLKVTLYWRANAKIERSYKVFVHLYDQEGNIAAQRDRVPGLGIRPTTSWKQGEVIADRYSVEMNVELVPGVYSVAMGMYDADSGERIPAFGPDGARLVQDRILLGEVSIRP